MKHTFFTCCFLVVTFACLPAQARLTEDTPITDGTAHVMGHKEKRVGLYTAEFGLFDRADIGTSHLLWLAKISNAFIKVQLTSRSGYTFAVSGGAYGVNLREFSDKNPDANFYVLNGGLHFTRRFQNWSISVNGIFARTGVTEVSTDSEDDAVEIDLSGAAEGVTGLIRPNFEWRLSKTFAIVLEGHVRMFQTFRADVHQAPTRIGDRITIETFGQTEVDTADSILANGSASLFWSFDSFNLRLGLQYGHVSVPLAGFFFPEVIPLPVIDMYWRF